MDELIDRTFQIDHADAFIDDQYVRAAFKASGLDYDAQLKNYDKVALKAKDALTGKAINIHHSFLPGFKGANPYRQAHSRGVKLIGATAHFVTSDLDEGPIIEQNVRRVDHTMEVPQLVAMGQEQEARTLTEAVRLFSEHRVLLDGARTVIFR